MDINQWKMLMNDLTVDDCKLISLPKDENVRGNLTFIESMKHVPFDIKRVFYIYDIPADSTRGAHAHHNLHQFLICLAGSFEISVKDTKSEKIFSMNRPWFGLHIPPMIWASEINFAPGSVCLVLVSDFYDGDDYIRDYQDYFEIMNKS